MVVCRRVDGALEHSNSLAMIIKHTIHSPNGASTYDVRELGVEGGNKYVDNL